MSTNLSTAPVLLIIFNRPDVTRRVLEAIRSASPSQLFVAADGPRVGNSADADLCSRTLDVVRKGVSWDCDVKYLVSDRNLGCGKAPATAISWLFDHVESGVILEDDCLPTEAFFPFCTSLLTRYADEPRVAHIGGFNCQFGRMRGSASYYFSRIFHCWGWASWRRAWTAFDFEMKDYEAFLAEKGMENLFNEKTLQDFWRGNFDAAAYGDGSIWDYQWVYKNLKEDRLAIVPNWNMIENLGFGKDATHTARRHSPMPLVVNDSPSEITHPLFIMPNLAADEFTYRTQMKLGQWHRIKRVVRKLLLSFSVRPDVRASRQGVTSLLGVSEMPSMCDQLLGTL